MHQLHQSKMAVRYIFLRRFVIYGGFFTNVFTIVTKGAEAKAAARGWVHSR